MTPKRDEWKTGNPEWTMKIVVPKGATETDAEWDARFESLKAAGRAAFPEN